MAKTEARLGGNAHEVQDDVDCNGSEFGEPSSDSGRGKFKLLF